MSELIQQMEKDQTEVLDRTENIKSLAGQVKKLRDLEDQVKIEEQDLKDKKKEIERISGEVIPTLLSEMGQTRESVLSIRNRFIRKRKDR